MVTQIQLGEISVDIVQKDIKNIHLSVHPPTGEVRISAPLRMKTDTIRVFVLSKLSWIRQQQKKLREQERETPREYLDRESHYLWGKRYRLQVVEVEAKPTVYTKHDRLVLQARPGATHKKKHDVVSEWYRAQLKEALPQLIGKWSRLMGVRPERFEVRRMKTKWGSCSPETQTIRLNLELAKKPPECLEYIVVHEMAHLIVPTHNEHFITLLEQHMPKWRFYRDELNRLPVKSEIW